MAEQTMTILLRTSRLFLRPLAEPDLGAFAAYRSDPEVARYQTWTAPYSLERARRLLEEISRASPGTPGSWFQLVIERQGQPGIIGDCAFQILANDPRQAQIGFNLATAYQRQGYATEAVTGLLDYLFAEQHLHRVTATCDALNLSSARLLERLGMRREGHYLENIWFKGAWGDEFEYAMLDKEWQESRRAGAQAS